MTITMLKAKIHRATVTQAELDYVGSITVDMDLLEQAGILEYEKVQIVDVNNGSRFETYTIAGERGSGVMCLNGAAARMVQTGDKIILMAYAQVTPEEASELRPTVLFVDEKNKVTKVTNYENTEKSDSKGLFHKIQWTIMILMSTWRRHGTKENDYAAEFL